MSKDAAITAEVIYLCISSIVARLPYAATAPVHSFVIRFIIPAMSLRLATLALIVKDGKVLLGEKKKGAEIGSGTLNGPGGKADSKPDGTMERPEECIVRETREEIDIQLDPTKLEKIGTMTFFAAGEADFQVVVFRTETFVGEPSETSSMFPPQWYPLDALPFDRMLESDREWFARAAAGEKFDADVFYKERAKDFERIQFKFK